MEQQNNANPVINNQTAAAYNPSRIENYYDQVHKASWVRRAAGLFAGATLGIALGALVGLAASCIPFLMSAAGIGTALGLTIAPGTTALLTPLIALKSAAIYAGIGGFMGMGVGTAVGESAGAVAGGLAIREHQEIEASNTEQPVIAAQPAKDAGPSGNKYFSWKPAAFFATLCGAFGAATAATGSGALLSANTLLFTTALTGVTLTGGAAIIATAAVFAIFGSLFGIKVGRMSNELSNFYTKALTDDLWKKKEPEKTIAAAPSVAPVVVPERITPSHQPEIAPPATPQRSFSAMTSQKSLKPEEILAARETQQAISNHL